MIPGWYSHNIYPFYEYFISDDGLYISSLSYGKKVYINKYKNLHDFTIVNNEKIISNESRFLLKHLFKYGWGDDHEYTGDFFK